MRDGEGNSSKDLNFMENVYNKIITMKNDSELNFSLEDANIKWSSGCDNNRTARSDSRMRHFKR